MSFFRRAGSNLLRIIERVGDPGAEANRALIYGKDDTGVTQVFAQVSDGNVYQLTPPPSGGSVVNDPWGPRVTAHAADDEFTGNTLAAVWQQTGAGAAISFATRPQPFSDPGAANWGSFENRRDPDNTTDITENSWLRIQVGSAAGLSVIYQPIDSAAFGGAVPNTLLAWARVSFGWRNAATPPAGDGEIGISFFQRDFSGPGTGFSFADHATISLNQTTDGTPNQIKPLFWGRNGGVGVLTVASEGAGQNDAADENIAGFMSGYIGLQRRVIGGVHTYDAWVIDDGGRLYMGELAANDVAAAADTVAIYCMNSVGNPAGAMIFDVDFIRFYQGSTLWVP